MQDLYIAGAGGFARETAFLVEDINRRDPAWNLVGFIEDDRTKVGTAVGKYRVVGTSEDLASKCAGVVIAIGQPAIVEKVAGQLKRFPDLSFPNLIHPSAIMDRQRVAFGEGNIVCAGNIFTTDIRIGSFNIFNLASTYGHDVVIGDYNVFNPGLNISGGVKIAGSSMFGTGAKVLQYLSIGQGAVVGAGAVVTKDVQSRETVVGIPAKPLALK